MSGIQLANVKPANGEGRLYAALPLLADAKEGVSVI